MNKVEEKSLVSKEIPEESFNPVDFFDSSEKVKEYKKWKKETDPQLRKLVEAKLKGKKGKITKDHSPLINQFYKGFQSLLDKPNLKEKNLDFLDERVSNMLLSLKDVEVNEKGDKVNIFKSLASKKVDFDSKRKYFSNFILPRLNFLKNRDKKDLENYEEEIEISPSLENDEYKPHRSPSQEQEGVPKEAIAAIYPFFGGYYKNSSYKFFDTKTLKWRKEDLHLKGLDKQVINQDKKRVYRKSVFGNQRTVIELPQKWGITQDSIKWKKEKPQNFSFKRDQNGLVYLEVDGLANQKYDFSLEIGPSSKHLKPNLPVNEGGNIKGGIEFPKDLIKEAEGIWEKDIPLAVKFRQVAFFIHKNLEYDKDDFSLEELYKKDKEKYLLKIWENKKAKCDEANTLAALLFDKLGSKVRFIGGHSVSSKSEKGEALLLDGNRHAWLEAYDEENEEWIRLDATPKGDPNVDQEEQKEGLEEGDYGEQEADLMSDEELEKVLEEMKKSEELVSPEMIFAKEAGCSLEEAKEVLEKISQLREKYKEEIKEIKSYWRQVLRKNLKEKSIYKGPVRQSQGDSLKNPVSAFIDIRSGQDDPTGFEVERKSYQQEKIFGGYEVYLLADLSGSMEWFLDGIKKSESQRDMVFLLADNIMTGAAMMKQKEKGLKYPMPNKVSLTVFGKETKIVLPLTDKWGPAEQIKMFKALDESAKGSTPDHLALKMVEEQIEESKAKEEEVRKRKAKNKDWKMNRFVIATADGGSDNFSQVKKANDRLAQMGIPTNLLLICQEKDVNMREVANHAYQESTPVSNIQSLAKKGMEVLIKRIKEIYGE